MNIETPVKASRTRFQWDDPFLLEDQLTEEERMIRDTARQYVDDRLMPRVTEASEAARLRIAPSCGPMQGVQPKAKARPRI